MRPVVNDESTVWRHGGLSCAMVAFVLVLGSTPVLAEFGNQQKLVDAELVDLGDIAYFGTDIDVSGDTVLVGAPLSTCDDGLHCGSAYIYRFNGFTWQQTQTLSAVTPEADGRFGRSVSIGDTVAVVGSNTVASVFRSNGSSWEHEQDLPTLGSVSVSVDQSRILASSQAGVIVYRFNGTSWVEEQTLTAAEWEGAAFGGPVSLSGDTALIGRSSENCAAGIRCGSAFMFRFDGNSWVEQQKLTPSNRLELQYFGISTSVSGDTALIGAYFDSCADGPHCGAAYVFRFNGNSWVEEQRLTAADATDGDNFGVSVSLTEGMAVVGAENASCNGSTVCGATYVYRNDGTSWAQEQKLISLDAESGVNHVINFGHAVAVDGNVIAAGAWHDPCSDAGGGQLCGSAFVFRAVPPIPATSTWGLMSLTLLLLAAGTIAIRWTSNGTRATAL